MATGGTGEGVEVGDGVVYLSDGPKGLSVIDVSDRASPAVIGQIPIPDHADRVRVVGNRLYVAAGAAGLRILDIQLAWPQFITTSLPEELSLGGEPYHLSATASSGLPVSFAFVSGPARLTGELLELAGPGTVVIQMDQAGDEHFLPTSIQRRIQLVGDTAETVVRAWFSETYPEIPETDRGLLADPDGDGVANVLECLLGSHPGRRGVLDGRLPAGTVRSLEGQPVWEIAIEWNKELAALLDWRMETSSTLESGRWATVAGSCIQQTPRGLVLTLPVLNSMQFVRLRIEGL